MALRFFNTLSKQTETFIPLREGHASIYHCGPTVYWVQHIGNMRAVVISDTVRRTLEFLGYEVDLVRNYTDVGHLTGDNIGDADTGEDRMEKAAKRDNQSPDEIAEKYIAIYNHDIELLNTLPPTHTPRATAFIGDMVSMVQVLLDKGYAYTTPSAIFFSVEKFPNYTALSGQKLALQEGGTGHGDIQDNNKKHPSDFVLWFFKTGSHANALQTWESPFSSPLVENGRGFPGWHIECSAMSKQYLGETLDIHMGGIEHIPIHHTNEIAQSECANSAPFVHYWLHNEHLLVDGKKMAKSEGTSYILADIIEKGYHPLALRFFFLQAHYRSKQNFTWDALAGAQTALLRLYTIMRTLGEEAGVVHTESIQAFREALEDDINTSKALALVWDVAGNTLLSDSDKKATLLAFDTVLGLGLASLSFEIPEEVQKLLDRRNEARLQNDWTASDTLREEIESHGFVVKDTKDGTTVIPK